MDTIFEIFDFDGKLTRKGILEGDTLNAELYPSDAKVVIRDSENEALVYQTSYVKPSQRAQETPHRPIIYIEQAGDLAKLYINTFKEGHTHLCYLDERGKESEVEIKSAEIEINLKRKSQKIRTRKGSSFSETLEFSMPEEKVEDFFDLILIGIADNNSTHRAIIEEAKERAKDNIYPSSIIKEIKEEMQNKEALEISLRAESIINQRRLLLNESSADIDLRELEAGHISVSSEVKKIIVSTKRDDFYEIKEIINIDKKRKIPVPIINDEVMLKILGDKDSLISVVTIPQKDFANRELSWSKYIKDKEKTEEVQIKAKLLTDVCEEIREIFSIEKDKFSKGLLVGRPELIDGKDHIEVLPRGYELLKSLEKPFFISIVCTEDAYHRNSEFKIRIDSKETILQKTKFCISKDKCYLIWIEDDKGTPVSKPSLLSCKKDLYDYEDKLMVNELILFESRFINQLSKTKPSISEYARDVLKSIKGDLQGNYLELYKSLIPAFSHNGNIKMFVDTVEIVMESQNFGRFINDNYFTMPIEYEENNRLVRFPKQRDFIILMESFNMKDSTMKTEYIKSKEIRVSSSDFYIISAIDVNDYTKTGYIFVSNLRNVPFVSNWRIGLEVKKCSK